MSAENIYDKEKSGWLIEDVAEKLPEYNFTIICGKKIEYIPKHKNINYISGGVNHESLRNYYSFADVTFRSAAL